MTSKKTAAIKAQLAEAQEHLARARRTKAAALAAASARKRPAKRGSGDEIDQRAATPAEELFARAYLARGLNATKAYQAIHPKASPGTCRTEGSRMLGRPAVADLLSELAAEQARELKIEADELLRHVYAVATADHRELTQFVYRCCRYCHGKDHGYQRTTEELRRDRLKHEDRQSRLELAALQAGKDFAGTEFDEEGGDGFDSFADPHPECPNCRGRGVGRMEIADTRRLSEPAAVLFAGVEETKDGLKVRMHDKMKAQDMLFRHKGLFEADNAQLAAATSPQALEALARGMEAARAKQLQALADRRAAGFDGS